MNEDKSNLPTLQELHIDSEEAFKNDQFKYLMNQPPVEKWMKVNPYAGNSKYLPIDKVELMLDRIFQNWKCEVLREGVMANSIYVTVRIHYKHPLNGQWFFHDGVGAKGLQVNADMKPSDLLEIKQEAVQMALPMAKSYAIKDACDHLGKLFGRDANRKGTVEFAGAYTQESKKKYPDDKSKERLLELIESSKTIKDLEQHKKFCTTPELSEAWDKKFKTFK